MSVLWYLRSDMSDKTEEYTYFFVLDNINDICNINYARQMLYTIINIIFSLLSSPHYWGSSLQQPLCTIVPQLLRPNLIWPSGEPVSSGTFTLYLVRHHQPLEILFFNILHNKKLIIMAVGLLYTLARHKQMTMFCVYHVCKP